MALFMILAALGFIASLSAHVSTFTGLNPSAIPGIWGLYIGIIVVFLPAIFCQYNATKYYNNRTDSCRFLFRGAPIWLRGLIGLFFAYAVFNFFFTLFVLLEGAGPSIIDGQYVLSSHGEIIRQLTEAEYIKYQDYEIRLFSGHWMVSYLGSFIVLMSNVRKGHKQKLKIYKFRPVLKHE